MHKSALPHIATDVSTRDIGIHCGVDRLKFWLDQDIRTKDLQADGDSTRAESISARMPMNPLWRTQVDVTAPTLGWLRHFQHIAASAQIHVTYVELAVDILFESQALSAAMQTAIIGHVKFMHRRDAVSEYMGTYYCGTRTQAGKRSPHVVAVYADRPSKMAGAHGLAQGGTCAHLEHRLSGSGPIAAAGIRTLADLIQFDHRAYHAQHNRLYHLPSQTELGGLLPPGRNLAVDDAALRKRARKWRADHQLADGSFCLHNALRDTPGLERQLQRADFSSWLAKTATRIAMEK